MKIVTYNTHYAIGKDNEYDLNRTVDAVRDADIIALQEVERHYGPPDGPSQPEAIAKLLPQYYWVFDAAFDIDGCEVLQDGSIVNRRRQHGQMLLSRWPILSKRHFPLPRIKIDHRFNMQMGVIEGVIETPIGALRIYNIHCGSISSEERQQQVQFLLSLVQDSPERGGSWTGPAIEDGDRDWSAGMSQPPMSQNTVVLGDFNMKMGSPEYEIITHHKNQEGQTLLSDMMTDKNPGSTALTWHPNPGRTDDDPAALLDYCFLTQNLATRTHSAWIDESADGSDHQPLWIELEG
jgi:endonuclease/exonuclease/phosphatase family metal-dependent hydrolase